MSKYTLNVEADEILHTAAFALEKTFYKVTLESGKVYLPNDKYTKQDLIKSLNAAGKRNYEITSTKQSIGPPSHSCKIIKNLLNKLRTLGDVKLWLTSSDKSNFRFKIPKIKGPYGEGYKAGRPPKPIYYNDCRDYLLNNGAEEIFGYEADDALGIHQTDNTVAVHMDKDINRIDGRHLNWRTGERYIVSNPGSVRLTPKRILKGDGNLFFFAQMLSGDRTDNIPSLGRFGPVEIHKILSKCQTETEAFEIVSSCFNNYYGLQYKEAMYNIADLLYILGPERITGRQYLQQF